MESTIIAPAKAPPAKITKRVLRKRSKRADAMAPENDPIATKVPSNP